MPSRLRHILNARAQILDAADETPYETLAQKLAVTEEQMIDLRLAGDLTIAAFFAADKTKEREIRRKDLAEKFRRARERVTDLELEDELLGEVRVLKAGPKGVNPFHWELEFPEVFRLGQNGQPTAGFDGFIGNPPFLGGTKISTHFGDRYLEFLTTSFDGGGDRTDLVAYFFRRTFGFTRRGGACGLIATNTIAQGDTRKSSLWWIRKQGGVIFDVRKRVKWPGRAAVVVSVVCFAREHAPSAMIDGQAVNAITAYLVGHGGDDDPQQLLENSGLRSEGFKLSSNGFVFDDGDVRAMPLAEKDRLLSLGAGYEKIIRPYIGGDELNDHPQQLFHRWAINFGRMTEAEAAAWPEALAIVREKVKPYRDEVKRKAHRLRWWQYGETRPGLVEGLRDKERALCNSRLSGQLFFAFLPTEWIFSERSNVSFLDTFSSFAFLQSRVHEMWARFFGSTMKDDLLYTPTDCFETFPFPAEWRSLPRLDEIGRQYYDFRAQLMIRAQHGLTETYNRFHNKFEQDADILRLRELHAIMDRAALDAYGWTDLCPRLDFILDYEDEGDGDGSEGRNRKKPWRYRRVDDDRDEVLARLLELNRTRAQEEGKSTSAAPEVKAVGNRGLKSTKRAPFASPNLFEVQEPIE